MQSQLVQSGFAFPLGSVQVKMHSVGYGGYWIADCLVVGYGQWYCGHMHEVLSVLYVLIYGCMNTTLNM